MGKSGLIRQAQTEPSATNFGGAGEEGLGERWEELGGRGGYGSGLSSPSLQPPTEVL